jgi:hypothetical protein
MRRWWAAVAAVTAVGLVPATGVAAAAAPSAPGRTAITGHCSTAKFTGAGGYFSAGNFYRQPGFTVTLHVRWCWADGVVTSRTVTDSTRIGASADPRFTTGVFHSPRRHVVTVFVSGDYLTGILNNVGEIYLVGRITGWGTDTFADESGSGG